MDKSFIPEYVTYKVANATLPQLKQWTIYHFSSQRMLLEDINAILIDDLKIFSEHYLNHLFVNFYTDAELEILYNEFLTIKGN